MRWRRYLPGSNYIRASLILGILFSVILFSFAWFLTAKLSKVAMEESNKYTTSQLNQAVTNSSFILQEIRMLAINMYADSEVNEWILQGDNGDPLSLSRSLIKVQTDMATQPFIHSVVLVNFEKKQVYATDNGLYQLNDFYDKALLDILQNNRPSFMRFFNHTVKGASYLALIAETTPSGGEANGYIVLLLDKARLNNHMLQLDNKSQSNLVVLDNQKQVVLGNADNQLAQALPMGEASAGTPYYWTYDGMDWAVQSAVLEPENWRIYQLTPVTVWNHAVNDIRMTVFITMISLLLLLLAVAFWNARRQYKPIGDLAVQVKAMLGLRDEDAEWNNGYEHDETKVIALGLKSLNNQVDRLNLFIKNHQTIVKEDYLRQWILSESLNPSIQRNLANETTLFQLPYMSLAVIRIDAFGAFAKKYHFASRKLMKFAMGNIAQEILEGHEYVSEVVDFGSDHMVVLAGNRSEEEGERLKAIFDSILVQIDTYLQISATVALSGNLTSDESMSLVYRAMYDLTLLRFLKPEERVFMEDARESSTQSVSDYSGKKEIEMIIQSIRMKDETALKKTLKQFIDQMSGLSFIEFRMHVTQLIYEVIRSFNKVEHGELSEGQEVLNLFGTIHEMHAWLEGQLIAIIGELGEKQSSNRREEVASEMVEFIQNHFHDPTLTVDQIAEHVSLSVGYIYQIFKEYFDCTLSEYILARRIEHVKKLLTETQWPILDIAEQAGFQTKSHFFTVFKKATGLTPNQYRLSNQQKNG